MHSADEQVKNRLIANYLDTRHAILEMAASLPPESQSTAFVGEWTVRELLAHLCGWDHTFQEAFQQILAGSLPDFFTQYDHNWKRYNNRMVKKYRKGSVEQMIAMVSESQQQLAALLQNLPEDEITADCGICTENGFRVTISSLMESIIHEEKEHLQQILDFKNSLATVMGDSIA